MWIVAFSICSAITMVLTVVLCSCWRRERQKDDWQGLDGMVTQKNPDENVNHLPSATSQCTPDSVTANDDTDASKRAVTVSNPRRSLPDIPSEQVRIEGGNVVWNEPTGDNSSELYATVEQYRNSVKRQTLQNGIDTRPSISQHSSISQADDAFSPYARVNYDKVHKLEHPYARVQSAVNNEQDENSSEEAVLLRPSTSQSVNEPIAPRSRRTSTNSVVSIDIPAASAVAGGIAANQELPYMTPPINQPNFSGDSQDSSKGYTSISVREPLANIRAQTKEVNKLQRDLDPHYSTVSDDSDEMYTTIQDPNNQLYMSNSETYAQIQPVILTETVEVNPIPCSNVNAEDVEVTDRGFEHAPQPPSVDSLKHVAHSHSRQASSSSSVGVLGSPKPEKRQANSPLPPPPAPSPDALEKSPIIKNIDDMYAKVQKNRKVSQKEDNELQQTADRNSIRSNTSSASPPQEKKEYEEKNCDASYVKREHDYETLKKQFQNDRLSEEPGYASINGPDSLLSTDPGYEVLKRNQTCSESDPNYEPLRHRTGSCNENSIIDGYSVINKQRKHEERKAKNYENGLKDFNEEPNYESMPSELGYDNYTALKSDSENDPNYESVNHNDPNYESVKYLDVNSEPPYERLDDDSSRTETSFGSKLSKQYSNAGYETINVDSSNGSSGLKSDPPYERLHDDENGKTDSESSEYEHIKKHIDGNQIPGYETVKPKGFYDDYNNKEDPHYDTVSKEKSGTSTSDDLQNSDEDVFEV